MKKRIILIHGWGGNPQQTWLPLIKKDLENQGWEVLAPAMPDTDLPKLDPWLLKLKEVINIPDEDLYLVGHSLGCITIMRYLETLSKDQKVGGVLFVAGFSSDDLNTPELKNFFETPINFAKIRQKASNFVAIHSDDDPYVSLKHGSIFKKELGAKIVFQHNIKHFSDPKDNKRTSVILQKILKSMIMAAD